MIEDNWVSANIYTTDDKQICVTGIDSDGAIATSYRTQEEMKNHNINTVRIFGCIIQKSIIKMIIFTDDTTNAVVINK